MQFCNQCGTVLSLDLKKHSLSCQRCGANEPIQSTIEYTNNKNPQDKIVVLGSKERNLRTMPQVRVECPKCGNNHAFYWMVQTRSIDESATQFFRCTECKHTWREYS